ncbi:MmgE/PrpD family protein [Rhodococcus globerulus]|uniref:MmgE/PrpD family protein n=1 Tax=Rhodococcus globerulus TaxID=33008 RepID=UPI000B3038E6|nr:MmgE/PrpD family protein [Rhodococcus globerulus]
MSTTLSATGCLAQSVADLRFEDLPQSVLALAKQCVLDTLGVGIAGASQPICNLTWDVLGGDGGGGQSAIWGTGRRASGTVAAMVNGIAAHALDYDDMHMAAMGGHPSAPLLPAVLAAAQESHASGADTLTAFVAGFETQCRIGLAVAPTHYHRGFHTTATIGTFGAAAGTARLLHLEAASIDHALGIAALSASGLKVMFGSMGKPLQVGRAAASGLLAARLAERGVAGAPDALVHPQGFAATHADEFDDSAVRTPFGSPWHIVDVLFKSHASCFGTHASIEAVLHLRDRFPLDAVDEIEVRVPAEQLTVCAISHPHNGLEGKFSISFTAALALLRGTADESQFTDDSVADPVLIQLASKVRVVIDNDLPPLGAHVTVTSRGHEPESLTIDAGTRAWSHDPTEQDQRLQAKFRGLVAPVLGNTSTDALIELVTNLDELDDINSLTKEL